jgi:Zn-dependent membrane protease YugP
MSFLFMLDWYFWLIVGPAMLLALAAQAWVKATFARYSRVGTRSGITGAQAAYEILRQNAVGDVTIEAAQGFLSDHYNPSTRTLGLSPDVFNRPSISAVGVAAHEAGHALQHAKGFFLMPIRTLLIPAAMFSNLAIFIIILGFFLQALGLVKIGILIFSGLVLFQIITVPIELDASRRALAQLKTIGILTQEEISGARSVLLAAAMTYVASAAVSIAYLLYFLLRAGLLGGRRS